jgi:hypothetical protein
LRASSTSSFSVCAGTDGWTATTCGETATIATGAKSRTGSHARLRNIDGLPTWNIE